MAEDGLDGEVGLDLMRHGAAMTAIEDSDIQFHFGKATPAAEGARRQARKPGEGCSISVAK